MFECFYGCELLTPSLKLRETVITDHIENSNYLKCVTWSYIVTVLIIKKILLGFHRKVEIWRKEKIKESRKMVSIY